MRFLAIAIILAAQTAHAYEFRLQFTPQAGARGLVVAGYQFTGNNVAGNCSYYTVTSGSGRVPRSYTTYHYNSCTWDLYGNLVSVTPQSTAPVAPPPLYTSGAEVVYATLNTSTTGVDTRGFGFVDTPSSHFTWVTPNGGYSVIPYAVYTITATLTSDGDLPLTFNSANVLASISGTITPSPGTATIASTTCPSSVPAGTQCSVTVSYNPTTITCTASPYGYAYTKIDLSLVTDAGGSIDFTQGFTITGVPICDD